jgi:hypothetical protein
LWHQLGWWRCHCSHNYRDKKTLWRLVAIQPGSQGCLWRLKWEAQVPGSGQRKTASKYWNVCPKVLNKLAAEADRTVLYFGIPKGFCFIWQLYCRCLGQEI